MLKLIGIASLILLAVGIHKTITHAANFYSIGNWYESPSHLLRVEGSISTAKVISDGCGSAGIEQDVVIVTDSGELTLEVINWYRNGKAVVGITVYQHGEYDFGRKVDAIVGEIYDYEVYIYNGDVRVSISNNGEVILQEILRVGARYIPRTASYIEYWRDCNCPFYYYGWVSISDTEYLNYKEDYYYKSPGMPFDMYLIHRNWKDYGVLDKGEIDDRLGNSTPTIRR